MDSKWNNNILWWPSVSTCTLVCVWLHLPTQCGVLRRNSLQLISACGCVSLLAPLRRGVLAVEWVLELYDMSVPFAQQILLFGVILHQLGQRCELLPPVQVIVVARVLNLDVRHLIVAPGGRRKRVSRGGLTPEKQNFFVCMCLVRLHPADI